MPGEKVKDLGWFWLTDSWYSIHLGETHLFESSSERIQKYPGNPGLDYNYIRWLEDFFDILPQAASDIPQDLYALISSEETRTSTENQLIAFLENYEDENEDVPEEIEDIYYTAMEFVYHGAWDTLFYVIAVYVVFAGSRMKSLHYYGKNR